MLGPPGVVSFLRPLHTFCPLSPSPYVRWSRLRPPPPPRGHGGRPDPSPLGERRPPRRRYGPAAHDRRARQPRADGLRRPARELRLRPPRGRGRRILHRPGARLKPGPRPADQYAIRAWPAARADCRLRYRHLPVPAAAPRLGAGHLRAVAPRRRPAHRPDRRTSLLHGLERFHAARRVPAAAADRGGEMRPAKPLGGWAASLSFVCLAPYPPGRLAAQTIDTIVIVNHNGFTGGREGPGSVAPLRHV